MKAASYIARCVFTVSLLTIACGPEPGVIEPAADGASNEVSLASDRYSDWSTPVNLGPVINTRFIENSPEMSKDGLSLYFGSNRSPGGQGAQDIWVSRWSSVDGAWGDPANLGPPINTPFIEAGIQLSRDGHFLYFTSNRTGSESFDIWVSRRADVHDDFGWEQPVNLGSPVNSELFDAPGSMKHPEFYFWRGPAATNNGIPGDIYVSEMRGGTFGAPTLVAELSSGSHEQRPSIRFDGREIFLSSNRLGSLLGSEDIWTSTRTSNGALWELPTNLGSVINSDFRDTQASLSEDGLTLLLVSNRPEGQGDLDLYIATRMLIGHQ
jgi:hypothetical protein